MSPEQFAELQQTISTQINVSVNGKIDKLNSKIDNYIASDTTWKQGDQEWKDKVQPDIDSVSNAKAWGKITFGIMSVGTAVLGLIYYVYEIIKLRK